MHVFTKAKATELSNHDVNYVVREIGDNEYVVWDCKSDHRVEFDEPVTPHYVSYEVQGDEPPNRLSFQIRCF